MRATCFRHRLLLALLSASGATVAQPANPAIAPSGWQASAGAAFISVPRYLGAERRRTLLLPSFEARRADGLFFSLDKGIGVERALDETVKLSVGLAVDLDARRSKDDPRFAALPNIREAAALRVGVDADLGPFSLSTTLQSRLAQRSEGGSTWSADATYGIAAGEAGQLSLGVTGRAMDARYARNFLSLDAAGSTASGLPAYRARAGLLEAGLLVQGVYRLSDAWTLFGRASASRLSADAAGSPLVRKRHNGVFILSASKAF